MSWYDVKLIATGNACFINEPEFRKCAACNKMLRLAVSMQVSYAIIGVL